MGIFGVLALAGPLLLLATAMVSLAQHGPLGWLAAVALLAAVVAVTAWCWRVSLRWWRGTKVAPQVQVRPTGARRYPPR